MLPVVSDSRRLNLSARHGAAHRSC